MLSAFLVLWLSGALVSYGKYIFIMSTCTPYKELNIPAEHFEQFEYIWYDNFRDQWGRIKANRISSYLVAIGVSLAMSWVARTGLHSVHRLTPGYTKRGWRFMFPSMPDKETFRMAVIQRRFGNQSWKAMVHLKRGDKNVYIEN